jgi:putative transposase
VEFGEWLCEEVLKAVPHRHFVFSIPKDNYLLACGSYVELNPVRAGIAKHPGNYNWSSYRTYTYGNNDELVDAHPIYENLSPESKKRKAQYRDFILSMLQKRKGQKGEMAERRIYGSAAFVAEISKAYKAKELIRKRGRPKKVREEN